MSLIIKKGDKLEFIERWDYSKDKQEKNLHKLIEKNLQFIFGTETEKKPILVIGSRMFLPCGELDILFVDNEGNLTLVELKRGKAARRAVAQILDYGASLSEMSLGELEGRINAKFKNIREVYDDFSKNNLLPSPEFTFSDFRNNLEDNLRSTNLVIASYDVSDEVKKIANWLRSTYSLPFICIEFEYFKKGDFEFFKPNVIGVEKSIKIKKPRKVTTMQKQYYDFFEDLLHKFKTKKRGVTERHSTHDSWLSLPSSYGNSIHFEWALWGREPNKKLGVELHFESNDKAENLKILRYFEKGREEYKKKLKENLIFEAWGKKYTRIFTIRPVGTLE